MYKSNKDLPLLLSPIANRSRSYYKLSRVDEASPGS